MDEYDSYDQMPSGDDFWGGSWDDGGFYNDPNVQIDDPNAQGMPVPLPGGGWGYDHGDGYYEDLQGNIILPNGQTYNGSGDVWSGAGDGSTGGYSSPTGSWGNMLGKLGTSLSTPKGAMAGLQALAALYGMKQQRDATNAARAPVGAPTGGAFFGASLGANPATGQGTGSKPSFQLPQARNFQDVIKRYAEGGPVQKEAGILALIKRLISGQQPGAAPAPAPAPTIGGAADALANGRRRQMEALGLKRGGLGALVDHPSGGQDDKVPAMLSGGEYVFDADAVSALGDGSTEAGAAKLDKMRENIRAHKRSAPPNKIPPKAKAPEQYMKGGK